MMNMQTFEKMDIHISRFSIWPLIARKVSLSLLLLERLKEFLEIKYMNSYWYVDAH